MNVMDLIGLVARPALLGVVVALLAISACGASPPTDPTPANDKSQSSNPLQDAQFYVNPDGPAVRQLQSWRAQGDSADADAIELLAGQPTAVWFAGQQQDPFDTAQRISTAAVAADKWPVFTLYNIPDRDCGQYSAGGSADREAYLRWVRRFAIGLGDRPAVVIIEPDAVAQAVAGCQGADAGHQDAEAVPGRQQLLADAVDIVKSQPGAVAYLDAGHPSWIKDIDALAGALRASGVERADGFSLNVSNFQTTDASGTYGTAVSDALGGKHFVIDTGRNGAGPLQSDEPESWCNPPDRLLGQIPTGRTGIPRVDAFLWVKQPGNSDGNCRGGPAAGVWSANLALDLAG